MSHFSNTRNKREREEHDVFFLLPDSEQHCNITPELTSKTFTLPLFVNTNITLRFG